jgi:ABC-type transporter Mla MlaB component
MHGRRGPRSSMPTQPQPSPSVLVIAGPLGAGDMPMLCERLRLLLVSSAAEIILCDVDAVAADAVTVDALARLQLTARRFGRQVRLQRASRELDQLLGFVGLAEVLATATGSGVELERQPEEREQPRGVEKRVDREDAVP